MLSPTVSGVPAPSLSSCAPCPSTVLSGQRSLLHFHEPPFPEQLCNPGHDGVAVLPVCLVLLPCYLIVQLRTDFLADLVLMVKVFLFSSGFFRFTLLLGDNEVRALQMFFARFLLACSSLHFKAFCHHVLHQTHVLLAEFVGFARIVVHPVPHNMGMQVRLPSGVVSRYAVMPLVEDNECLRTTEDIAAILGTVARHRGFLRASGAAIPNKKNEIVWWPNTEHHLWHNELSENGMFIYEYPTINEKREAHLNHWLSAPEETRITFLRYKDDLGFCFYRFVGVFKLNKEKSIKENKCVWERISNTYQLNV